MGCNGENSWERAYHVDVRLKPKTFTIAYEATAGGRVDPASESVKKTDTPQGSTATPNEGYEFVGWYDAKNNKVSDETYFAPTSVSDNVTYYARFAKESEGTQGAPVYVYAQIVNEKGERLTAEQLTELQAQLETPLIMNGDAGDWLTLGKIENFPDLEAASSGSKTYNLSTDLDMAQKAAKAVETMNPYMSGGEEVNPIDTGKVTWKELKPVADGAADYGAGYAWHLDGQITVTALVDLKVEKTVAKIVRGDNVVYPKEDGSTEPVPEAEPNDVITWNITVSNGGCLSARIKAPTDTLTMDPNAQDGTKSLTVMHEGAPVGENQYTVPKNGSINFTAEYTVTDEDQGKTLTNVAKIGDDVQPGTNQVQVAEKRPYEVTIYYYIEGTEETLKDSVTDPYDAGVPYDYTNDPEKIPASLTDTDGKNYAKTRVDGALSGSSAATITVYYSLDEKVDPTVPEGQRPTSSGDGIPDIWQVEVTFNAMNGTFAGVAAPGNSYTTVVTKKDDSGNPAAEGTAKLAEEHIKDATAAAGYLERSAIWKKGNDSCAAPEVGTEVEDGDRFTVTFAKSYTVTYTDGVADIEVFEDRSYEVAAGEETPAFDGGEPARAGYVFEGWAPKVAETVTESATYIAQWAVDAWIDPTVPEEQRPAGGGDGIPDKYQAKVTFWVINGTWNDRTTASKEYVVTLYEQGENGSWVKKQTDPTVMVPSGMIAASGYTGGSWAPAATSGAPLTVSAPGEYTYTYTFIQKSVTPGYNPPSYNRDDDDDDDRDSGKLNTNEHHSYIIGYKDGTIRPYGTITRGEVATIFFRLLTDETRDRYWSQTNPYSDCNEALWCNNAISTLTSMGILDGFQDGTFRPYAKITRAQFAKIAVGFFETDREAYSGYFTDVPADAWFTEYIEAASRAGLIQGFADGTYRPDTDITRAQACVIVNRALGRKPDEEHLLKPAKMITWPDNNPDDWFYADIQEATNSHDYRWLSQGKDRQYMEQWTARLEQRNWAALEHAWSTAHSAPGGEVLK